MQNNRYQPRLHSNTNYIPAGARPPVCPGRDFSFQVVPPPAYREPSTDTNPWDESAFSPSHAPPIPPRPRVRSLNTDVTQRPPTHLSPVQTSATKGSFAFPEPQIYQPTTSRPMLFHHQSVGHRHSRSDLDSPVISLRSPSVASLRSTASSYGVHDDPSTNEVCYPSLYMSFRKHICLFPVLPLRKT